MANIQQQLQQKPESTTNASPSVFERDLEEFVLEHYDECMSFTSCSSPGTTVMEGEEGDGEPLARRRRRSNPDSDAWAESSASRRHHSGVLRKWAAQKVEMITIERRNRESELRALAGLHTVSMLDASFLRESLSPTMRNRGNLDKPSTQTSSILQMWLELEDENVLHHARERSSHRRSVESNANAFESEEAENQGRVGEATESHNDYAIRSHDHQLGPQSVRDHDNSSCEQSPDLGEVERMRQIGHGWMESGINDQISKVMQSNETPRAEWLGVTEHERLRIVRVGMQMTSQQRGSHREEQNNEPDSQFDHALEGPVTDHEDSQPEHIRRNILRIRGRQALLDLLVRFKRDRERELQDLKEQCLVSDFAHRNRFQTLLRGIFLRNERPWEEERPPSVAANELNQLRQRHTVSGLREGLEGFRSRLENIVHVQLNSHSETPSDDDNSDSQYDNSIANESREIQQEIWNIDELVGILDRSTAVQSTSHHGAPVQGNDQQREVIEGERTVQQLSVHDNFNEWIYNTAEDTNQNQPENSVPNWPSETTLIEDEHRLQEVQVVWRDNGSQETVDNWSGGPLDPPRMQRSVPNRLTRFHPADDDNVYNVELRELLNRRRVSNFLCSGFRENLEQLIQSYVERQGMLPIDSDTQRNLLVPPSPERDQDLQNDDQNEDHPNAVVRSSLIFPTLPVPPTLPLWHQDLHHSSLSWHSVNLSGLEMINDLRLDMAKLQEVMNLMQRLLDDCMDMQQELQRSVRRELSAALNRSTGGQGLANTPVRRSKWGQVREGTCCICCDNQIDCLLYRCGHMCTCSKCGNELILGEEKCPLCQVPIVEVVRAYSILNHSIRGLEYHVCGTKRNSRVNFLL